MDKEELAVITEFESALESRLLNFFNVHGFKHRKTTVFENGNKVEVEYSSNQLRLKIYRSQRDGEINCLIGSSNEDDDKAQEQEWFFINSLLIDQFDFSIDELLTRVSDKTVGDEEQISEIANLLERNFSTLLSKVARKEDQK